MRIFWTAAVGLLLLTADAHADTVYLKDGQSVWGSDVTEEGDTVVVVRPGGALRFPKGEVARIERTQLSIPRFYSPPAGDSGQSAADKPGLADRPPADAAAGQGPAAPGSQPPPAPPSGVPPVGPPTQGPTTTVLPPPPSRQ